MRGEHDRATPLRLLVVGLLLGFAFGLGSLHAFENLRIFARFYDDTRNGRVTSGGTLETSAERVLRDRLAKHREVPTT